MRADEADSRLAAAVDGHGPRVVLVHGFTQNRNCWARVASGLARDHEIVRVDAPGHGDSSQVRADLSTGARLLAERGGPATYLGYSMGARFVLHVGLLVPGMARGLVVLGAAGGIDDDAARADRKRADDANASRLEAEGLEPFLDTWLAQPLFAGLPEAMQFRDERRTNSVDGLASSLRLAGTGSQEPLWTRLHELEMPVLVVAGADDTKFSTEAERLAAAIGTNATIAFVPGAGHAAHLEQPDGFLSIVRRWLAAHEL